MDRRYRMLIADEFRNCVNNTIERVRGRNTNRPFHSKLLSDEALFWSAFERSFSTSFGQRVIEEIAKIAVLSNGASDVQRQKETHITIDQAYVTAITSHIQDLRSGRHIRYDWNSTLDSIYQIRRSGNMIHLRVISDMWWQKDGIDNYISLKTVMPNIDQTAVAKEDCLHLKLANPMCNVYFGLPYNPYGEDRALYAFYPPMRIFDFHHDPVVLIGKDLWDTLGGPGCYEEILQIAGEVGEETRDTIKRILT